MAPDPATAPVVRRIYAEFLQGAGYLAIAERLNAEQVPSPSGHDPDRNPHRQGIGWTKHTVRAILVNPRYTGYQVWNRQRRDEVLLDIDDVAAGYVGRVRWNPTDAWIFSEQPAHQPLIAKDDFDRVQTMIGARAWRHKPHKPAPTHRVYLLRKRLRCGICSRRLQGHWVHNQPYYRCSYPPEYQAATGLDHPRTVYLREADLLPHLDQWLARLFDPDHLDPTLDALEQASNDHTATTQQLDAAEQAIADSKRQLAQYRAALAAGADPTEVTAWINQATAAKAAAEAERARLRASTPKPLDRAALRRIVTEAGGLLAALDNADRTRRAALYDKLGIEGVYQPTQRLVVVTADLVCQWLVSEGRLDHWAYRSSRRPWRCRCPRVLRTLTPPALDPVVPQVDRSVGGYLGKAVSRILRGDPDTHAVLIWPAGAHQRDRHAGQLRQPHGSPYGCTISRYPGPQAATDHPSSALPRNQPSQASLTVTSDRRRRCRPGIPTTPPIPCSSGECLVFHAPGNGDGLRCCP